HRGGVAFEIRALQLAHAFHDFRVGTTGLAQSRKSPLTSAINTGTPRALKFSASVCNVTVLPVPVAPAIKPWRFAIFGSKKTGSFDCATRMGSFMIPIMILATRSAIVQR